MLRILTTAALALTIAAPATAGTLAIWDTLNGTSVAGDAGPPVNATDLTRGAGLTQNVGSDFNSRGWTETDLFGAVLNGDYLEFGLSSASELRLNALEIAYDRSATGPMELSIFAAVNGGGFSQIFSDASIDDTGEINIIDLTTGSVDFQNVNDITFRLFGWGATSAAGTFDIETGNVGPGDQFGIAILGVVPLPAGLPLLAGGLGLMGLLRRKR